MSILTPTVSICSPPTLYITLCKYKEELEIDEPTIIWIINQLNHIWDDKNPNAENSAKDCLTKAIELLAQPKLLNKKNLIFILHAHQADFYDAARLIIKGKSTYNEEIPKSIFQYEFDFSDGTTWHKHNEEECGIEHGEFIISADCGFLLTPPQVMLKTLELLEQENQLVTLFQSFSTFILNVKSLVDSLKCIKLLLLYANLPIEEHEHKLSLYDDFNELNKFFTDLRIKRYQSLSSKKTLLADLYDVVSALVLRKAPFFNKLPVLNKRYIRRIFSSDIKDIIAIAYLMGLLPAENRQYLYQTSCHNVGTVHFYTMLADALKFLTIQDMPDLYTSIKLTTPEFAFAKQFCNQPADPIHVSKCRLLAHLWHIHEKEKFARYEIIRLLDANQNVLDELIKTIGYDYLKKFGKNFIVEHLYFFSQRYQDIHIYENYIGALKRLSVKPFLMTMNNVFQLLNSDDPNAFVDQLLQD